MGILIKEGDIENIPKNRKNRKIQKPPPAPPPELGITLGEVVGEQAPDESGFIGGLTPMEKQSGMKSTKDLGSRTAPEEQAPVYEPPKKDWVDETAKIVDSGLENYLGSRMQEAERDKESAAKETYADLLHKQNRQRYEKLKVKKASKGGLTPAEQKEYIDRGGSMVKKKGISTSGLSIQSILDEED